MLDEILKSIKAQLYDRAVSPLMGSFIISWGIWNYKFLLLVISGVTITEKYRIIDEVLFGTWQQIYLRGALYPIITSLVYLYAYPYPSKYVFEFSRNRQKEISDIKRRIEDETLLTAKESRSIRREIYALEEEFQKDLERKNSEIERLKLELEEIDKGKSISIDQLAKSANSIEPTIDKSLPEGQLEVLKKVGESEGAVSEQYLIDSESGSHIKNKYNLEELAKNGYLERGYDRNMDIYTYDLTHKGRSYLVKNKHV